MLGQHATQMLLVLLFCLWPTLSEAQAPTIVYRADLLSPDDLKNQRRFLPRGMDGTRPNQPPPDTSLYNHIQGIKTGTSRFDSGYVATTTSLDFARQFLHTTLGSRGYIYKIHVSANFIDVSGTLRQFYSKSSEAEISALGGIQHTQVLSWIEFREGVEQTEKKNPDYDKRFDQATWGGAQIQLAGFPRSHRAWSMKPWSEFSNCGPNLKREIGQRCAPEKSSWESALEYMKEVEVATQGEEATKEDKLKNQEGLKKEGKAKTEREPKKVADGKDGNSAKNGDQGQTKQGGLKTDDNQKKANGKKTANNAAQEAKEKAEKARTEAAERAKQLEQRSSRSGSVFLKNAMIGLGVGVLSVGLAAFATAAAATGGTAVGGAAAGGALAGAGAITVTSEEIAAEIARITDEVIIEAMARAPPVPTGPIGAPVPIDVPVGKRDSQEENKRKAEALKPSILQAVKSAVEQAIRQASEEMTI